MKNTIKGDITELEVDAIVNAANSNLQGGGGVDGAIHKAAGAELLKASLALGGCPTGEARITKAFNLPSKYVIHAVGPIWKDGNSNELELLKSAYWNSLVLAQENNCKTIAFPNISTGVYGVPKIEAAHIALETVSKYLNEVNSDISVTFVCFDELNFQIYKELCPTFKLNND